MYDRGRHQYDSLGSTAFYRLEIRLRIWGNLCMISLVSTRGEPCGSANTRLGNASGRPDFPSPKGEHPWVSLRV